MPLGVGAAPLVGDTRRSERTTTKASAAMIGSFIFALEGVAAPEVEDIIAALA